MPCGDGGVPYPPTREELLLAKVPLRALCALLRAMNSVTRANVLSQVDWLEAGITRDEFNEWWENHQRRDRARKRLQKEAAEHEALARKARSKLTAKERKALGIK